jgi:hypothetical protein
LEFLGFLAQLLKSPLELIQLLAQLREALSCGIEFLTAFLGGIEIGFLLSVCLIPTTILDIVRGVHAPMLLAQVAMPLETDFLGDSGHRFHTRLLLPILALVRNFLGRLDLAISWVHTRSVASRDIRSKHKSIGIMPFSWSLYWSCH